MKKFLRQADIELFVARNTLLGNLRQPFIVAFGTGGVARVEACHGVQHEGRVFRGSPRHLPSYDAPVESEAAQFIIDQARNREEARDRLKALILTYLRRGGFEVQVNVVDGDTLRAARTGGDLSTVPSVRPLKTWREHEQW